jgi:hypothetical protein
MPPTTDSQGLFGDIRRNGVCTNNYLYFDHQLLLVVPKASISQGNSLPNRGTARHRKRHLAAQISVPNLKMTSRARPDERQPLLSRIDEEHDSNRNAKVHYNLAGLSQRHFWILVS